MQGVCEIPMKDTIPRNFDINLNINITNIKNRYQSQYQYCRTQNLISIPIPRIMKFKLNLKTISRYLDILRSQANTQKNQASIAHLCNSDTIRTAVVFSNSLSLKVL